MSQTPSDAVVVESDKPNLPLLFGLLAGAVVVLVILVIGVDQYFNFAVRDEIQHKVLDVPNSQLRELHAQETAHLSRYRWVDQKAGIVQLPLDRAAELTLRDWDSRPAPAAPTPAAPPAQPEVKK